MLERKNMREKEMEYNLVNACLSSVAGALAPGPNF